MTKLRLSNVPIYLMMIFSLLLIGIADFAVAGFNIERFKEAGFWFSLGSSLVANFMMLTSTALSRIDYLQEIDEAVKENDKKLKDLVNTAMENDIDGFLKEENDKRKIDAWKCKIDRKILKREKRNKNVDVLKEMLVNAWILEHLNTLKVRYYHITKMELISGYRVLRDNDDRLLHNKSKVMLEDNIPSFLITTSVILFFTSFVFESGAAGIGVFINFVVKFMVLIWNAYRGYSYGRRFIEKFTIRNQLVRIEIFKKYLCWKIGKKESASE